MGQHPEQTQALVRPSATGITPEIHFPRGNKKSPDVGLVHAQMAEFAVELTIRCTPGPSYLPMASRVLRGSFCDFFVPCQPGQKKVLNSGLFVLLSSEPVKALKMACKHPGARPLLLLLRRGGIV